MLDTIIKIEAFGPNASSSIDEVFARIGDIESKMTVNADSSEIIEVNKRAGKESYKVSPDTFYVVKKGLEYSRLSQGKFDITIGPSVKLWGIGTDKARIPRPDEIEKALELVDYTQVLLDEKSNSIFLKKEGMALDLGAIAKGYAADEAARILRENGVKSGLIDLGGNIYALGKKPDGKLWKIGVQNPFEPRGSSFATLEVADKTLVTSGIYERYFEENGKRYHHILDTATGFPVENGLASVTIISESSIDADAMSTMVFSMGLDLGTKFIERQKGIEAIFVTTDRKVYATSGVKNYNFKIIDKTFGQEDI